MSDQYWPPQQPSNGQQNTNQPQWQPQQYPPQQPSQPLQPNYGQYPPQQYPQQQYPQQQYPQQQYPQPPPQTFPQSGHTQYPSQPPYPQPGQYQPRGPMPPMMPGQRPPRKSNRRTWIIVGVIVGLLVICGGISNAIKSSANSASTSTISTTVQATDIPTQSADTPTYTPFPYTPIVLPTSIPVVLPKVGSTISADGVDCTLVSVKHLQSDGYVLPKQGNEFIVVRVKLVNNSGSGYDYNEFYFHAISGSGNVTDSTLAPSTYTANNELNSGTLTPGGTVEGDIILEVPIGDHKAELGWQSNIMGNATDNVWNLGL